MPAFLAFSMGFFLFTLQALGAESGYRLKREETGGAAILSACFAMPYRDLTCQSIVELNDFSIRFINRVLRQTGLKEQEEWLGPLIGVLATDKLTTSTQYRGHQLDLTYNVRTQVISFNATHSFQ